MYPMTCNLSAVKKWHAILCCPIEVHWSWNVGYNNIAFDHCGAWWALLPHSEAVTSSMPCLFGFSLGTTGSFYRQKNTRFIVKPNYIGVNGCLSLHVSPALKWQLIQGVYLSPIGCSTNRTQAEDNGTTVFDNFITSERKWRFLKQWPLIPCPNCS